MKNNPFRIKLIDIVAGVFLLASTVIFVIALFVIDRETIEPGSQNYYTLLSNSFNIKPGSKVSMFGLEAGEVGKVFVTPEKKVHVDFFIYEQYVPYMVGGSFLEIGSSLPIGDILGGAGINVKVGESSEKLKPNSYLKAVRPIDINTILTKYGIEEMVLSLKETLANLQKITASMSEQNGSMQKTLQHVELLTYKLAHEPLLETVMKDKELTHKHMQQTIANLDKTMQSVSERIPLLLENANKSAQNLAAITSKTDTMLTDNKEKIASILTSVNQMLYDVNAIITGIRYDSNMTRLLKQSDRLIKNSNELTENINSLWLFQEKKDLSGFKTLDIKNQ